MTAGSSPVSVPVRDAGEMTRVLGDILDRLDEKDQTRVRITEYWNQAIWVGTGVRYSNDWNRNVGTLARHDMRSTGVFLARDTMHRARTIRDVDTTGVPEELVAIGDRVAGMYEQMANAIVSRMVDRRDVMLDPEVAEKVQEDLEALRVKLNREHGLDLHPIRVVNEQ